ncbi:MAG: hypothetical protein JXA66_00490 [Oligoflexia bacterium]|nr:hypothetical protein [Oligoflexia bacterium]
MNLNSYSYRLRYVLVAILLIASSCAVGGKKKEDRDTGRSKHTRKMTRKRVQFARPKIKVKMYVFDFFNKSPHGAERLGIEVAESFRKRLSAGNNMVVIEPKEIEALKGKKISEIDFDDALKVLKANDVRVFGYGTIEYLNLRSQQSKVGVFRDEIIDMDLKLNIRFVELRSGKVMFEKDLTAHDSSKRTVMWKDSEKSLYDEAFVVSVIDDVTSEVVSTVERAVLRLNWQGRVAKIMDTRVYINAGKKSGVEIGDLLKVVEQGEEVIDPQTGALIGIAEGRVKGTVEVKGYFGNDGSVAEIYTGGGFMEGDKVELY